MDWLSYIGVTYGVIAAVFLWGIRSDSQYNYSFPGPQWQLWVLDIVFSVLWPVTLAAFFYAYIMGDLEDEG